MNCCKSRLCQSSTLFIHLTVSYSKEWLNVFEVAGFISEKHPWVTCSLKTAAAPSCSSPLRLGLISSEVPSHHQDFWMSNIHTMQLLSRHQLCDMNKCHVNTFWRGGQTVLLCCDWLNTWLTCKHQENIHPKLYLTRIKSLFSKSVLASLQQKVSPYVEP